MSETRLVKEILLDLGNEPDLILWRNNTGKLADVNGRWVTYGLAVGSSDIIGVLAPWGRLFCLEPKATHSDTCKCKSCSAQRDWGIAVTLMGGYYERVRSVDDARLALRTAREWARTFGAPTLSNTSA